jgi:hypothetical protein
MSSITCDTVFVEALWFLFVVNDNVQIRLILEKHHVNIF